MDTTLDIREMTGNEKIVASKGGETNWTNGRACGGVGAPVRTFARARAVLLTSLR